MLLKPTLTDRLLVFPLSALVSIELSEVGYAVGCVTLK